MLFIGTQFSILYTSMYSPAEAAHFAVARNDLQQAWHGLLKMYQDENKPLEALIDRLQAEQHLEMMRLMAAHPPEGTAWEDA